jgi:hypothetical protein
METEMRTILFADEAIARMLPGSVANDVAWSTANGADEYQLQVSTSASYTAPYLVGRTFGGGSTNLSIDVPGTRYIRVRACNGVTCGAWKNGSPAATYYSGCL